MAETKPVEYLEEIALDKEAVFAEEKESGKTSS